MPGLTNFASSKLLDHANNKTAYTAVNLHVGLYTAAPSDSGGGTEVSGGSYARVSTTGATWNAASNGVCDNASVITFPTATADWGTVVAAGRFDAASAGNLWDYGNLTTNKTVQNGDTASFAAGEFDVNYNSNN